MRKKRGAGILCRVQSPSVRRLQQSTLRQFDRANSVVTLCDWNFVLSVPLEIFHQGLSNLWKGMFVFVLPVCK